MKLFKAPTPIEIGKCNIFLSGSIEMGTAENWQDRLVRELADEDVNVYNPRRDDWDSSWVQSIANAQFREQVTWELNAMENSDIIATYFDPNTKSPITLLELGLFAQTGLLIVCCPEGFWRKGNVDIVCKRYGVHQVDTKDELVSAVKAQIEELKNY